MRTQIVDLTVSWPAKVDLFTVNRFVGVDGDYCKAGKPAIGVLDAPTAEGEMAPLNMDGILLVESGDVITAGDQLASDSVGRAVKAADLSIAVSTGSTEVKGDAENPTMIVAGGALPVMILGFALDDAAGAGEFIRYRPL